MHPFDNRQSPIDNRRVDLSGRQFDRILLIKPSSLGDVIHALPVLRGLRRRFPAARIDWLIGTAFAPLLHGHPDLTELILFDRRRFGRMAFSPRAASEFVGFMGDLRARRYDLAIDLQGLFRSGFITRATGAPVRLGFQNAREGARMFYTHCVETPPGDIHAVDKNYLVAEVLGFADVPIEFHLPIAPEARTEAQRLCGASGEQGSGVGGQKKVEKSRRGGQAASRKVETTRVADHPSGDQKRDLEVSDSPRRGGVDTGGNQRDITILIAPGARWETKRWLPERFAETIDSLHVELASGVQRARDVSATDLPAPDEGSATGVRCVLVGGREDQELCVEIARRCQHPPLNLCGGTTLPGLAALVDRADLVLCHDSGVAHIAAALNRPLVCISGPTNPRRTGPYRREQDVLRLDLECSPCYLRRLSQCPHKHRCMRDLQVRQVVEAVRTNVEKSRRGGQAASRKVETTAS